MYNSEDLVARIKARAKERGVAVTYMLKECGLASNTIYRASKGMDLLVKNVAKIADFLDCSIDYLMGRTDNPDINK